MEQKQVFLTNSPTRWQRFKWTFRIIVFFIVALLFVLGIALVKEFIPGLPALRSEQAQNSMLLTNGKNAAINAIDKKYRGFGQYISGKEAMLKHIRYVNKSDTLHNFPAPLRAAFYDASDEQAYFSLKNNISRINMILPLWMTIDTVADTLLVNTDLRGIEIIRASGVKVVAVVSNFAGEDFSGAPLNRIFADATKRERLENSIVAEIRRNKFAGVNVDFEELTEKSDASLVQFMSELYGKMHPLHLLVTQDVAPFNTDYDLHRLSLCNDYMFLMAYDEHNNGSAPGAISAQKWIAAALDEALDRIDSSKLVLGIAGYGYDWPQQGKGSDVTYEEALSVAGESDGHVVFDTATFNLSYAYTDDNNVPHQVYFTDAATNFNTIRYATGYNIAGFALWRMGSEDSRLWSFYNKNIGDKGVDSFNYDILRNVNATKDVDYKGEGEVLDVVTTPKPGIIIPTVDTEEDLITNEQYDSLPSIFVIRKYGKSPGKVVLSFDDGPDERYTPRILDILSHEHVPAVFFLIGENAVNNIPLVKRMYNEGYEIGNHTFTHPNIAGVSMARAQLELNSTRLLIESITGHSTILFRAPYNADSEPETMQELEPVALAKGDNYLTIGESIDPNDWEKGVTADTIFSRIVQQEHLGSIILLHDAGGNREATIAALPAIIKYFKSKGYTFTTVADLLHENRDELMPAVPKNRAYYLIQFSYLMALASAYGSKLLMYLFISCIILSILRIVILAVLAARQQRTDKHRQLPKVTEFPKVSIIVPAYNEEVNAVKSLHNLLRCTYPNFEIIFVDDGSKDRTYELVAAAFHDHPLLQVCTKSNGGKASALNYGIARSDAGYVMCIDADTNVAANALSLMMAHFANANTGAVAGNVKVGNEVNLLTRWQSIEYITSQNFDRKAFAYINAITVVPGAIGVFRKKAIEDAGGFTSDTYAEDCDLTMRILRAGYTVENENSAIALTEAPESLGQFMKQRFRWSFGVMQSFWKNRDALFNGAYGSLGWVALPNILIFQMLIPLIAPIADVMMVVGLFTGNAGMILIYYGLFMLIDLAVGIMAFKFEHENVFKLVWFLPQRLAYRWLMLYILFKSVRRAFQGRLQSWGVLKRTGNVGATQ